MLTHTTSQAGERTQELPKVISDRQVLHRDWSGLRIGRVQEIAYLGKITTVNFWYENGNLHHVA